MDFSPVGRVCSFCGVVGTSSTKFAGGLGAMMCRECVEYYHGVLSSPERTDAVSRRPPWESMSDADMLSKLPLIAASAEQVDEFLRDWIRLIRARGISWAEIGKVMGISRQAAWERFRDVGPASTAADDVTA